jgi:hypothetical protein
MSRLEVPLLHRTLWATGDVLLRAELRLLLKDRNGIWKPRRFRVDSGSEMTTMFAFLARQLNLPFPPKAVPGVVHHQTGLEIRSGILRVQVVGMDGTEYGFPCFFLGDPNTPPPPHLMPAVGPENLLGMSGVVDKLRIYSDGRPAPGAL